MELISIITPVFNRAHLLNETWESIKNQTYPNWEWIVVDDGSTDSSFSLISEIAKADRRVKLYSRSPELIKGPSSCRNYGVKLSQGMYLIFLDSDDLLNASCLKFRASIMSQNSSLDFSIFSMQCFIKSPGDNNETFNV